MPTPAEETQSEQTVEAELIWPSVRSSALPAYQEGCGSASPFALYESDNLRRIMICVGAQIINTGQDVFLMLIYRDISNHADSTDIPADGTGNPPQTNAANETRADSAGTSPESPVGFGNAGNLEGWSLRVNQADLDAWDVIRKENASFNVAPRAESRYILINITAVYSGVGVEHPLSAFQIGVVGAASRRFYNSAEESCGLIPDPLDAQPSVLPGGAVSGNLCFEVDEQDIDGMMLYAETFYNPDGPGLWMNMDSRVPDEDATDEDVRPTDGFGITPLWTQPK